MSRSIGFLMISSLFLLTACTSQDRSHDCKEYAQAIQRIGPPITSNTRFFSLQSRQDRIQFLNSMSDNEKRSAQAFQSMKLKDSKAKQIQNEIVKILEEVSQDWRDKMRVVESLSEGSDRATIDNALQTSKTTRTVLYKKLNSQFSAMDEYCKIQR